MRMTVLIPTYRRPDMLAGCLKALTTQERAPDEVLVVVRDTDEETQAYFAGDSVPALPITIVPVTEPGQVAALNAGLEKVTGEFVCILDDDAEPHPPWLARMAANFSEDPQVGGVGGRDWIYENGSLHDTVAQEVGRLHWHGRWTANHHCAVAGVREVDMIKGANMSYRMAAVGDLRFDTRLRGKGSQIHNDSAFSLAIRRRGWKLRFDETASINHYVAARHDEDVRHQFNAFAYANVTFNETLVNRDNLSPLRFAVYLAWITLVGTRANYGLVQMVRFFPKERGVALKKVLIGLKVRGEAMKELHQ